jgi:hypothetical protein
MLHATYEGNMKWMAILISVALLFSTAVRGNSRIPALYISPGISFSWSAHNPGLIITPKLSVGSVTPGYLTFYNGTIGLPLYLKSQTGAVSMPRLYVEVQGGYLLASVGAGIAFIESCSSGAVSVCPTFSISLGAFAFCECRSYLSFDGPFMHRGVLAVYPVPLGSLIWFDL